jgi:hypothetical protein
MNIFKFIRNKLNTSKIREYCPDGGHKDVFGRTYKIIYKTKKPIRPVLIGVKTK